jgi:hypothetical protein
LLLILALGLPARAQVQVPDLWVTVFCEPDGRERLAVAYNQDVGKDRIGQDIAEVAGKLGVPAPKVKITVAEGIPAAEAEFRGLADWKTGAINLDPLIQAFKRYGRFRASFFFLGDFPAQPAQSFDQPPLRVESERSGNTINYRITIDQKNGVPAAVPLTTTPKNEGWRWIVGLTALSVVVAVGVFLVTSILLNQRRARTLETSSRTGNAPGSATPSRGTGEGKL